jgi:PAS domain S-box-containing protein
MLPQPDHARRNPSPVATDDRRPRAEPPAGEGRVADAADDPFARRVDQFARQIATMRRHACELRRHAAPPADVAQRPAAESARLLDDLIAALESLNTAEEELQQQHEELGLMHAALERERLRYQSLFDDAPVPYLVTGADGMIREANHAAVMLLGVNAAALAHKPLAAFVAPDDRSDFRERLAALPLAEGAQVEFAVTLNPRDGVPIEALVVGECAPDPLEPKAFAVRWVVRDVTAERAAEHEIRRLNEELETRVATRTRELAARTAELEAASREKSRFLATLSHEIRTPVAAVVGYADLLEAEIGGPLTAAQRTYVDRLRASTGHLLSLVEGVLDLAKVEAGRVTLDVREWPLDATVEDALAMVRPQADGRRVRLVHACAAGQRGLDDFDLLVAADQHRVRQVLVNLLANAIRFTQAEGTVTVRCGVAAEAPGGSQTTGDGPWVWTAVADTGVGIPPASLAAVFEPFVQADAAPGHAGSGLGLTISRRLARLMGGDLVAQSEVGRGSVFTLWLPAARAARAAATRSATPTAAQPAA